ncbi:MAG: response regulator [Desulfobulbaceae bacterium]|nr:response regulator [Desulfobulbaceae bacterium]
MNRLSILIVEDNPADVLLIKEYLSERGDVDFDIQEASTLESAINLISQNELDIILLDLFLNDSAGLDTVRKVIAVSPDIPVIILTGLQDEETAIQAVRFGAQDYLEKQILAPVLLYKSIVYAIERKRILQEKEDLFHDFTKALHMIENLEGILPICVSCKKIRDKEQNWLRIEEYINRNSDAEVLKLVCPSCLNELEQDDQS